MRFLLLLFPLLLVAGCYVAERQRLYLLEFTLLDQTERDEFEQAVRSAARALAIPADWLMAVMFFESHLDPAARNHAGSGACGLIQFMPDTIEAYNFPPGICELSHAAQMPYVQAYLEPFAPFESLTDLYLSILYPAARNRPADYVLFRRGTVAYKQNRGLDVDNDGRVTVGDITEMLRVRFPEL